VRPPSGVVGNGPADWIRFRMRELRGLGTPIAVLTWSRAYAHKLVDEQP
jgi:hypothetical protein